MSARTYDCPQCGAPVTFQSSITVFAVCPFCRSMVVRKGEGVEKIGEVASLAPDMSPLQIGTRGNWKGKAFELIGRIRVFWEQGSWSEWCAMFSDGQIGWIAEAQGFFMVTVKVEVPEQLPSRTGELKAGHSIRLQNHLWQIVDVKLVDTLGGEGELPFAAPPGKKRRNIDVSGGGNTCGTIEFHDNGPAVYIGEYLEFEQLNFSNLRPVPGWNADTEQVRHQTTALNCLKCAAVVELRAAGQTQSAVCGSCGTVIDTADGRLKIIQKADAAVKKLKPLLPIGMRGKIHGTDWEVIGMQTRADKYCSWTEYLLFNPWNGFRWLVNFGGHWSFIQQLPGQPDRIESDTVAHAGETYRLFAREKAKVRAVLGEFYWKVERGEEAYVSDFIAPPRIISWESYAGLNEHTWSVGVYLEPKEVAKAFGVKDLPERSGVYLNQPNSWAERWNGMKPWMLRFLYLYLAIQFLFLFIGQQKPLWAGSFVFDRSSPNKVETTPQFHLNVQQPISIDITADVDNSWIGFDAELINAKTNQAYALGIGVEYYHGVDGGESWSEGGKNTRTWIPAVPPGDYFLNLEPEADTPIQRLEYRVGIRAGGLFWSNFWLGLLVLCAYPLTVLWRRHSWEHGRWAESDYSPYASKE